MHKFYLRLLLFVTSMLTFWGPQESQAQFYFGSQQEFGKNRIQHIGFQWNYYHFKRFKTYFYSGGEELAEYTAKSAHNYLSEIEKLFDYEIQDKLEFIIYNKQNHFQQSNIGITNEASSNIGGVTKLVGTKIFLYYEDSHESLNQQIKEGIYRIIINQLIFGANWKESVKSSTLISFPDWYIEGAIQLLSHGWNAEKDSWTKDAVLNGIFEKFSRLEGQQSIRAGHSFWNFVAEVYGVEVIPNILFMSRLSKNIESGFVFVLGMSLDAMMADFDRYYKMKYKADEKVQSKVNLSEFEIKVKKRRTVVSYKLSPDGRNIAFTTNIMGKYEIWLHNIAEKKTKRIAKGGIKLVRIPDISYPVINWHPTGTALVYIIEDKERLSLNIYNISTKKVTEQSLDRFDKVLDFSYSKDGRKMVLSAVSKGRTDIYLMTVIGSAIKQLTYDYYDDLHPRFVENSSKIIFSSNRTENIIRKKSDPIQHFEKDYDLFLYDLNSVLLKPVLKRVTETPYIDEIHPMPSNSGGYSYLSDENGVINRYVAKLDSSISHIDTTIHYNHFTTIFPLTNFNRSILDIEVWEKTGRYSILTFENQKFHFFQGKTQADTVFYDEALPVTGYKSRVYRKDTSNSQINIIEVESAFDDEETIDIENLQFDSSQPKGNQEKEFEREVVNLETIDQEEQKEEVPFKLPTRILYKSIFAIDEVTSQLDNNFLGGAYQRYSGPGSVYINPGLNALMNVRISDIFEDYKATAGFRLPANLKGAEYLLVLSNLTQRLDKHYIFHRNSIANNSPTVPIKQVITEAKYKLSYPFSEVSSIRGTFGVRHDREIIKSIDPISNRIPDSTNYTATGLLEYIYDNTIPKGLNIMHGTRFKLFAETYRNLNNSKIHMNVVGFDFRHYEKIHRNLTFAFRAAGNASFGTQKLVSYLGGVDNWILRPSNNFNNDIEVDPNQGYAYQTIATPMRGFIQNIRNGSNFALINKEVRWPIFKYFAKRPIKSDFLNSFQIVGFSDIGTAWTGTDPYSLDNSFNKKTYQNGAITIEVQNQVEPIVWGYGWGLRAKLLGYFVRFDYAWGLEDGVVRDPIKYISLTLDF